MTKSEAEWRKELGATEYRMLRQQGTEPAGTGEYHHFFPKEGYFMCRACNHPLYSSTAKFKDCGWVCHPSLRTSGAPISHPCPNTLLSPQDAFDKCFYTGEMCHVGVQWDGQGIEIICNNCGSHLGHVFYGEQATETDERH